jgi:DedD protein
MPDAPRKSYYQVSFTAGQGLAALLVMLAGLAVSFFLGVRAGFVKAGPEPPAVSAAPSESPAESASSVSAAQSSSPAPSATPAPVARTSTPPREIAGPPAPVVTETFEDREASSAESSPEKPAVPPAGSSAAPSRTEIAGPSSPAAARPAEKPAVLPRSGKTGGFFVQVISTASKAEAARVKSRLSARKYKASVSPVDSKKGKLYRVRVGPYPDREQAKKVAAKISSEEKFSAWVAPAE